MQNHRGKTCDWGTDTFQRFGPPDTPGASSSGGAGRGIDMRPHFWQRSQKGEKKGKDDANKTEQASEKKSQEDNEEKKYYYMDYYGQGDKKEGPPGNFEFVEDADYGSEEEEDGQRWSPPIPTVTREEQAERIDESSDEESDKGQSLMPAEEGTKEHNERKDNDRQRKKRTRKLIAQK